MYENRSSLCPSCPSGKFQDENSAPYTNADGTQVDAANCSFCRVGFAFTNTTSLCRTCVGGRYQPSNTQVAATCLGCDPGQYVVDKKAPLCIGCPTGLFQEEINATLYRCKECAGGHEIDTAATNCSECSPGQYQDHINADGFTETEFYKIQIKNIDAGFTETELYKKQTENRGGFDIASYGMLREYNPVCKFCSVGRYESERGSVSCAFCQELGKQEDLEP